MRLRDETRDLDRFYASVRNRLAGATGADARLKVMLEVYETFFKEAMPNDVSRLGIVYTPPELVDFILRSADAVLRREFGRGLTDRGVHVLDPFTGTGTFINRLLTQKRGGGGLGSEFLVRDGDLARKFGGRRGEAPEIHANEVVLLAYYLAAIKIEEAYKERTGHYEPFEGIVLTDTFEMGDGAHLPELGPMGRNSSRVKRQNDLPIEVIVGNPPWSAGQKSAGDDNPNIDYPALENRVRETYGRRHREVTGRGAGKSAGNLYVQAIRWASDRLNGTGNDSSRPGVVAFVHPNSLCNGTSLAGMRAALRDEFTDIYVVNLRGDAMKSGDEFRREGDKIFGAGSRNGVQITVLVRNPSKDLATPATLHYAEVPEYSNLDAKFEWLGRLADVTGDEFRIVPLCEAHHWVNLTDGTFDSLLTVCAIDRSEPEVAVLSHASGVNTGSDAYVYSFDRDALIRRVKKLIASYEDARQLMMLGFVLDDVSENDQLDSIKWTPTLRQALRRNDRLEFDEARIRECLYRPFTKLWLYADDRILVSVRTVASMFERTVRKSTGSTASPVEFVCVAAPNNRAIFGTLAVGFLTDFCAVGPNQPSRTIPRCR